MARCLRCGAGNEWIEGKAAPQQNVGSTDGLADFASDFLRYMRDPQAYFWDWEESEPICQLLEKHGFIERTHFDPNKHGDIDAEPGDEIWAFTIAGIEAANAALSRTGH